MGFDLANQRKRGSSHASDPSSNFTWFLDSAATLITPSVCWITDSQYSTETSPCFVRKEAPKRGPTTLRKSGRRWRRRVAKRDGQGGGWRRRRKNWKLRSIISSFQKCTC